MIETLKQEAFGWRNLNTGLLEPSAPSDDGFVPGWGFPTFEDHFDAPTLNSAMWNVRNGYQEAQDVSTMLASNVVVEDSCVKLLIKNEVYNGRDYTSAYIDTIGKWSRRYGRFEMKAKLPTDPGVSRGLWPAYWLRDATGGGEIDVLETIGTPNNHPEVYPEVGGYYSSSLYRQTGVKNPPDTYPYWTQVFKNIDVSDGQFHTWAFEWTPQYWAFFCDGVLQKYMTYEEALGFQSGFPSGVNIRLDVFVGSSWQGWPNPTDTILPRSFDIDYIRHWAYTP